MSKIGIMGGTFDPIHNGHLALADAAYHEFSLDRICFMPTGNPPHKEGKHVLDANLRLQMVELTIADYPYFEYSDLEIQRKGKTYTADTLTWLCNANPNDQFYYIVGADSLDYMDRWYRPSIIFQKATILAAMRNTQSLDRVISVKQMLEQTYNGTIYLMNCPEIDVSSSEIRSLVANHQTISGKVPSKVEQFIYDHALYV